MADYRAALAFFDTSDPRVKMSPLAPLCPVEVRKSVPDPSKVREFPLGMSKKEGIAYLRKALEGEIPWDEFQGVVTALPDTWVFEAYFPVAAKDAPGSHQAATVLFFLRTECPIPCKDAVRALLDGWDVSLEELPYYLERCFGFKSVQAAIDELEQESLTERQRAVLSTVSYWTSPTYYLHKYYRPFSWEHTLRHLGQYWSDWRPG